MSNVIIPNKFIHEIIREWNSFMENENDHTDFFWSEHVDVTPLTREQIPDLINFYEKAVYNTVSHINIEWGLNALFNIYSFLSYPFEKVDVALLNQVGSSRETELALAEARNSTLHLVAADAMIVIMKKGTLSRKTYRSNMRSIKALLSNVYILRQLAALHHHLSAIWNGKHVINDVGINFINNMLILPNRLIQYVNLYSNDMRGAGTRQRFAKDTTVVFDESPIEFHAAVTRVITGESPKDQAIFKGTFYELITPMKCNNSIIFWTTLRDMLRIFLESMINIGSQSTLDKRNVIYIDLGKSSDVCTKFITDSNSIKGDWKVHQNTYRPEYPVVRISDRYAVTSLPVLMDGIYAFVEKSIMHTQGWAQNVSRTTNNLFPKEVIDYLNKHGFYASRIKENTGVWGASLKSLVFDDYDKKTGEVDVLAFDYQACEILLIECTQPKDIRNYSSLGNTYEKLVKKKYEQVRIKHDYFAKVDTLKKITDYFSAEIAGRSLRLHTIILTDIPFPIYINFIDLSPPCLLCDFDTFKNFLHNIDGLRLYIQQRITAVLVDPESISATEV